VTLLHSLSELIQQSNRSFATTSTQFDQGCYNRVEPMLLLLGRNKDHRASFIIGRKLHNMLKQAFFSLYLSFTFFSDKGDYSHEEKRRMASGFE
jgi:hypothetical protein